MRAVFSSGKCTSPSRDTCSSFCFLSEPDSVRILIILPLCSAISGDSVHYLAFLRVSCSSGDTMVSCARGSACCGDSGMTVTGKDMFSDVPCSITWAMPEGLTSVSATRFPTTLGGSRVSSIQRPVLHSVRWLLLSRNGPDHACCCLHVHLEGCIQTAPIVHE